MDRPRRPRISLDLLRGFSAAARHLSFTRAAQELCVTQPAISREVKVLEDQLGQPLFHRVNRALRLTPAGEELYRATEEALGRLQSVVEHIANVRSTVAVTTTPALASLWLAPRLPRFNQDYPGIDVRVSASNNLPDLDRDQIDIAIQFVATGMAVPPAERLLECTSFPVCAPSLVTGGKHPIRTPDDLAHHARLDYESLRDGRRVSEWDFWFDALKIRRVGPASTMWLPQYDQLVSAAVEGSGVAVGVLPHVAHYLREGILCAPFGAERVAQRGAFFLVCRRDIANDASIAAFIDWLHDEIAAQRRIGLNAPPDAA
jgi:LysR family transcriptional regulator, glycine cleavage system transcriptional activator